MVANIIQVTNSVGSSTNKGRAHRIFKHYKHRISTSLTPSNSSAIPTSSISAPDNAGKNTTNSTTPKLTPLTSCTPINTNPKTNTSRTSHLNVRTPPPSLIQHTPLFSPVAARLYQSGSTFTSNTSSPHTHQRLIHIHFQSII